MGDGVTGRRPREREPKASRRGHGGLRGRTGAGGPRAVAAPGGDALDSVVRPALVAATRLFLVAGVALVLVDETGELRGTVAAGDLAQALEDAAPQLWSGPSLEVLASGAPVRTSNLRGPGSWPALAACPPWPA